MFRANTLERFPQQQQSEVRCRQRTVDHLLCAWAGSKAQLIRRMTIRSNEATISGCSTLGWILLPYSIGYVQSIRLPLGIHKLGASSGLSSRHAEGSVVAEGRSCHLLLVQATVGGGDGRCQPASKTYLHFEKSFPASSLLAALFSGSVCHDLPSDDRQVILKSYIQYIDVGGIMASFNIQLYRLQLNARRRRNIPTPAHTMLQSIRISSTAFSRLHQGRINGTLATRATLRDIL